MNDLDILRSLRVSINLLFALHGQVRMGSEGERVLRSMIRYLGEQEDDLVFELYDEPSTPPF